MSITLKNTYISIAFRNSWFGHCASLKSYLFAHLHMLRSLPGKCPLCVSSVCVKRRLTAPTTDNKISTKRGLLRTYATLSSCCALLSKLLTQSKERKKNQEALEKSAYPYLNHVSAGFEPQYFSGVFRSHTQKNIYLFLFL